METFYRRRLPHWLPPEAIFFITFRLANSVPASVLRAWRREKERAERKIHTQFAGPERKHRLAAFEEQRFYDFDAWLDRCLRESPRWLADKRVARIVAREIHALDGVRYRLLAYCIMPNHVHLLIDTAGFQVNPTHKGQTAAYPLTDTLRLLKGRTARYCNQVLGRSGAFWQNESYDRVVRDQKALRQIVTYIWENPVRAGLVQNPEDWEFTFVRQDLLPA